MLGLLMELSRNVDILYRSQLLVSRRKRLAKNRVTNSVLGPGAQAVIREMENLAILLDLVDKEVSESVYSQLHVCSQMMDEWI